MAQSWIIFNNEERILRWKNYIIVIQACLKLSEQEDCNDYVRRNQNPLLRELISEPCRERTFGNTKKVLG